MTVLIFVESYCLASHNIYYSIIISYYLNYCKKVENNTTHIRAIKHHQSRSHRKFAKSQL